MEGVEIAVLTSMRQTLERHRSIVLCELHDTNQASGALMRDLRYEVAALGSTQPVEDAAWNAHVLARHR